MRLKVYSIILLFLAVSSQVYGQFILSGQVLDGTTQKPISNAQVIIKENSIVATTNTKGNYEIKDLPKGNYTLLVYSYEYESITVPITVAQNLTKDFSLNKLTQELSEVVINDDSEEAFGLKRLQAIEGTAIYAGKKTEVILLDQVIGNMATNNARQVYAQIVGLNIYESNDGGLQLSIGGRGLDPNRSSNFNIRQNSYDISADVLGYPESYYTPPVEGLEEIEVIRGAASLQYGTQFGGLVNFKTRQPVEDKKISLVSRQTLGSFGLFTSFNSLSGTVGKIGYYTYFNYKQGDGYRPNSEFDSKNFFGHVDYQLTDKTKVSVEFTYLKYLAQQAGGLWDEQFYEDPLFSNRERNWFEVDWKLYSVRVDHSFNSKSDLSLNVFGLDAERNAVGFRGIQGEAGFNRSPVQEFDEINEFGEYTYNRDLITGNFNNWGAELRFLSRYKLIGNDGAFLVGSKFYQSNNAIQQGPGSKGTDADFTFDFENYPDYVNQSDFTFPNLNVALFGENVFFIGDHFSITPGIRFEYIKTESMGDYLFTTDSIVSDDEVFERHFALLGLGVSKTFESGLELYSNISENYRSVTFSDIRTVSPTFIIDENIKDESGYTADIGMRGKLNEVLSYDLGMYSLFYNDRIGIILDDRANRVRTNIGDAVIVGLEGLLDWNIINTFYQAPSNYRLKLFTNMAITDSEQYNAVSGNNNVNGKKVEFIPFVNLKTGINGGYKNLLGSIQFTYLSEQYTDAENSAAAATGSASSGVIGEIPSYQILDLSFSYTYKFLKAETGVNNLLDENYFTRRATGYPGPGIIPSDGRNFYFTLGIRL